MTSARSSLPMAVTIATVIASVLAGLGLTVTGLAMLRVGAGASVMSVAIVTMGVATLIWHTWALVGGAGRHSVQVNAWPPMGLVAGALFGFPAGYGLYELLTGHTHPFLVGMVVSGLLGACATLTMYIRDTETAVAAKASGDPNAKPRRAL